MATVLDKIKEKINYLEFYDEFLSNITHLKDHQYQSACPFHDDDHPSFGFDTDTGMWQCLAGCGSGNVFTFVERKFNLETSKQRVKWLADKLKIDMESTDENLEGTVDNSIWTAYHKVLLNNKLVLKQLEERRGLTIDSVRKFKLGFNNNRITIPVFDENGICRNIRAYAFMIKNAKMKMLNYSDDSEYGYGRMRLFPIKNLELKKVLFCEGEMDAILADQLGINSITVTSGAGSFNKMWAPQFFRDKQVWMCFDVDQAGKMGALKVARTLSPVVEFVKIMDLGKVIKTPPGADITDFFITHSKSIKKFKEVYHDAVEFYATSDLNKRVRNTTFKKVSLGEASHAKNAMKNIEVKALVSGKDFPPYEIPNRVECSCFKDMGERICPFCPLWLVEDGKKEVDLEDEIENGTLLNLIDITDEALFRNMKKQIGVPNKCNRMKMDTISFINVTELRLIPEIDFDDTGAHEFVQQLAYYAGHDVSANQVFTLRGIALPTPKTQQATQLFYKAEPAVDSIDMFEMSKELHKSFKVFQPAEKSLEAVQVMYDKRYSDMEQVSGIYKRQDIALGYDIILHSALNVIFQKKRERGWMEMLLIGDSGCGKTELAKHMIQHYGVGEFVTGESSSVAGLIGGLSQTGTKWHINWGKIPLNNRRALFIDEISGMSIDEIALFSGVRSSGVAELTKIRTEKTMAQTRKIWIGNPRKFGNTSRNMMQYSYGCLAVRELIGNLEDIRRFDLVMSAHSEEVNRKIYNQSKREKKAMHFTKELMHDLIMWIWSRKPDQITFSNTATKTILQLANDMGKKYHHGIPIVEPSDQRLKLMRGATAVAGMMYSTKTDGEKILVEQHHVEFFHQYLEQIYNKPSMRYGDWSERELTKNNLKDVVEVDRVVKADIIEMMIELDSVNLNGLIDMTGWERHNAKHLLSTLLRNNGLVRTSHTSNFYRKTEALNDYLISRRNGTYTPKAFDEEEDVF